ncbi:MAG: hypothetical protein MJ247_01220 [Alphaproteobacteria bacterium]|nr:hypothetical protein [Alphaproteobacteria bacterium]
MEENDIDNKNNLNFKIANFTVLFLFVFMFVFGELIGHPITYNRLVCENNVCKYTEKSIVKNKPVYEIEFSQKNIKYSYSKRYGVSEDKQYYNYMPIDYVTKCFSINEYDCKYVNSQKFGPYYWLKSNTDALHSKLLNGESLNITQIHYIFWFLLSSVLFGYALGLSIFFYNLRKKK